MNDLEEEKTQFDMMMIDAHINPFYQDEKNQLLTTCMWFNLVRNLLVSKNIEEEGESGKTNNLVNLGNHLAKLGGLKNLNDKNYF